jgi:Ca2+-binding RTX toxin-like protein
MLARLPRFARALFICGLVAVAAPASALAATTASVAGTTLTVNTGANEANDIVVQKHAGGVRVTDSASTVTPLAGCVAVSPRQVNCASPTIALAVVNLGDLNDAARVIGVLNAQVNGGAGEDDVTTGAGNDTIDLGTGADEQASGNDGNDTIDARASGGSLMLNGGIGNDIIHSGDGPGQFFGGMPQLTGGPGNDQLNGSTVTELFFGGTGADQITGGAGIDGVSYGDSTTPVTVTLGDSLPNDGGPPDGPAGARDRLLEIEGLFLSPFGDNATGGAADESIYGNSGADTINGGAGRDNLCGGGAATFFPVPCVDPFGGDGADILNGGDGDDNLMGNGGPDQLHGNNGLDWANWSDKSLAVTVTLNDALANDGTSGEGDLIGASTEHIVGGTGNDILTGNGSANIVLGNIGNDTLNLLAGNDLGCGDGLRSFGPGFFQGGGVTGCQLHQQGFGFPGSPTADKIFGGDGNDAMSGHFGADQLDGGNQNDTVDYTEKSSSVSITPNGLATSGQLDTDPVTAGNQPENDRIAVNVENLIGGTANDTVNGNGLNNALSGGGGTDTLNGLGGNDVLDPGLGGADVANGGAGFDYASYGVCVFCSGSGVTITLDNVADDGIVGDGDNVKPDVEGALGSRGGDTLRGPATVTDNTLVGYGGLDTLDGKAGNDSLSGGPAPDTLVGDLGNDFLAMVDGFTDSGDCGGGTDTAMYDNGIETPTNCETLQATGAGGLASSESVSNPLSAEFRRMEATVARVAAVARAGQSK